MRAALPRPAGTRRYRTSVAALLTAGALGAGLMPTLGAPANAAGVIGLAAQLRTATLDLTAAQDQAVLLSGELVEATARWEAGTRASARMRAEASAAAAESTVARDRTAARQRAVEEYAAAVYRDPGGADLRLAMTVGADVAPAALDSLQQLARRGTAGASSLAALREAEAQVARAEEEHERLLARADAQESELAAELEALRTAATDTAAALSVAQARVVEAQDLLIDARVAQDKVIASADAKVRARQEAAARAAAVTALAGQISIGPPCTEATTTGYPNGQVPPQALCPLEGSPGASLRADAAAAWNALSAASLASRGVALCVTDSYRDYASQVDVYLRKPTLAAIPGTSLHGRGIAVDVGCGGATFGSEVFTWMTVNAGAYGWVHPSWARQGGSRPEPWHWEFTGTD